MKSHWITWLVIYAGLVAICSIGLLVWGIARQRAKDQRTMRALLRIGDQVVNSQEARDGEAAEGVLFEIYLDGKLQQSWADVGAALGLNPADYSTVAVRSEIGQSPVQVVSVYLAREPIEALNRASA